MTQASGGVPSYLDQVATVAAQNVVTNAVNGAITTLNGVLTTITSYNNSLNAIANAYLSAISTLKNDEATCWSNIIQNVCVGGAVSYSNKSPTCTEVQTPITKTTTTNNVTTTTTTQPSSVTLHIATSTEFSSAVIQAQIATQANQAASALTSLQTTITAVNALITGVTNTTSQSAQNAALQQLDQLTASNSFPTQTAMSTASQQASNISQTMLSLINNTLQNWAGNTGATDTYGNPVTSSWDGTVTATTVGWCNYSDPKTQQMWEAAWNH
jgi:hypothetical protein